MQKWSNCKIKYGKKQRFVNKKHNTYRIFYPKADKLIIIKSIIYIKVKYDEFNTKISPDTIEWRTDNVVLIYKIIILFRDLIQISI